MLLFNASSWQDLLAFAQGRWGRFPGLTLEGVVLHSYIIFCLICRKVGYEPVTWNCCPHANADQLASGYVDVASLQSHFL